MNVQANIIPKVKIFSILFSSALKFLQCDAARAVPESCPICWTTQRSCSGFHSITFYPLQSKITSCGLKNKLMT